MDYSSLSIELLLPFFKYKSKWNFHSSSIHSKYFVFFDTFTSIKHTEEFNIKILKYSYFFVLIVAFACQNSTDLSMKKDFSSIDETSLNKNFQVYVPKNNSFVDSIINSVSEFRDLKTSIEDLTKLNPNGIESFLDETLIKCNNLLNLKNNNFTSRPEIRGRLKVLKTNILKCKFNNHQNDIKSLNESLKNLFTSYNILFERLEDFR